VRCALGKVALHGSGRRPIQHLRRFRHHDAMNVQWIPARSFLPVLMGLGFLEVAAQLQFVTPEAAPVIWEERLLEVATGPADRGPWRQNESRFNYVDDATVATATGAAWVAWVDQGRKNIFMRAYSARGQERFDQPVNVSRSSETFSWHPRIAIAPGWPETVHIAWQEIVFSGGSHGGEIFYAQSRDGGKTLGAPVNLSRSMAGDGKGRLTHAHWDNGSLAIATDARNVYVTWTEYEGALWLARSEDGGATFMRPQRIGGDGGRPARGPSLVIRPNGNLVLAWASGHDAVAPVRVTRSSDRGRTWEEALAISLPDGRADAPKLAVAENGVVHLVFAAHSLEGAPSVLYAHSPDGRIFSDPVTISRPVPSQTAGAGFPDIAVDSQGRVFVIWELFAQGEARARGLGLAVSGDGGINFSPPEVVPGSADPTGFNGSQQGLFGKKLAASTDGMITIVNSSFLLDQGSRVWAIRGRLQER
jgi:hypothetical protein